MDGKANPSMRYAPEPIRCDFPIEQKIAQIPGRTTHVQPLLLKQFSM